MKALDGIRVLDLSRVLAGPWATQILADLGADVLKIEAPGRGDDTRAWGPPYLTGADGLPEIGTSAYYLSCNRNKRSLVLDIASEDGQRVVRELVMRADVLVENFKVGGLARYGLDYASLSALNSRLVYCSITGFGQTGPYAERGGYDFVAQAQGGFMSVTGEEGGEPLRAGVAIADLSTGLYAAISILAALRHAEQTGEGQQIDLSLLDTQIAMLANQGSNWLIGGVVPGRLGNRHPTVVPYKTFEVADGTIVIAVGNDGQFRSLCEELGVPDLARDPRFALSRDRLANRDVIEAEVQRLVKSDCSEHLIARLVARGVPAGPVNTIDQVFADPFVEARDTIVRLRRDDGVEVPAVAFPGKLSATPARAETAPPRMGEGGDAALGDWLGWDAERIDQLRRQGALG